MRKRSNTFLKCKPLPLKPPLFLSSLYKVKVATSLLLKVRVQIAYIRVINVILAFMKYLRDLCDKHGIMLIVDEVQTGTFLL